MRSQLKRVSEVAFFCAANVIFGVTLVAHPIPASAQYTPPSKLKKHVCPDSAHLASGWTSKVFVIPKTGGWTALAGSNEPRELKFQSVKYLKWGQEWHVQCNYGDTGGIALMYDRHVLPNCNITSSNTVTCP
jgi:hypothetical protein